MLAAWVRSYSLYLVFSNYTAEVFNGFHTCMVLDTENPRLLQSSYAAM